VVEGRRWPFIGGAFNGRSTGRGVAGGSNNEVMIRRRRRLGGAGRFGHL